MLLLRILGVLSLITVAVAAGMYFYTRDRRYLTFIMQVGKYMMFMMIIVLGFLLLERVVYLL